MRPIRWLLPLILLSLQIGASASPIPRKILVLYDSSYDKETAFLPVHQIAEMPLNHLGFVVVFVDGSGDPVGGARTVAHQSGQTIEVTPPMTAAEIAAVEKVAVFTADITINDVTPKGPGMRVEVSSVASFAAGVVLLPLPGRCRSRLSVLASG